jgi:hypothetical protein
MVFQTSMIVIIKMNKWQEKYMASIIMNLLGFVLLISAIFLGLIGASSFLVLFFCFSSLACSQVACVNLN